MRERYKQGLRTKIEALWLAAADHERGSLAAAEGMRRLAHQLRGSGASYGFPHISAAAGDVEDAGDEELHEKVGELIRVLEEINLGAGGAPLRMLLVEDDDDMMALYHRCLASPDRTLHRERTLAEAERTLAEELFDLMVLDLVLPDGDGRTLLSSLRERPETASLPVVVISVLLDPRTKTECLALGADVFLEKPIDEHLLAAAVSSVIDRERRHEQEAREDALTGLPNRMAFLDTFRRLRALASRTSAPLSLALLDIDSFKDLNDGYGHAAGDEALRRLANGLQSSLREADVPARWGGDEFVVLFPDTRFKDARRALSKALDELDLTGGPDSAPGAPTGRLTVSAGLTQVERGETAEVVIERADRLLYAAKAQGGDCVLDRTSAVPPPARILLAEDDEQVAELVVDVLERGGFEVTHRRSGGEALAAAMAHPHELAVIDLKMPGMEGFELLDRLRHSAAYRRRPLLVLSSIDAEESIERAFALGADDYVKKPLREREFIARVRRYLRRPPSPQD